jgi:beta-N-acetylhexosaminidase
MLEILAGITAALSIASLSTQTSHEDAAQWARETAAKLTLERKVAQLVCEQMRGGYVPADADDFLYWSRLVRDHGIGGFVVYGGSPLETARLLNRLQSLSEIPLLFSADFEGGPGQQFQGASEFPANMALAAIGDDRLAYEVGKAGALEGRAIGIHVTYSPVVDVQTRPENPVLSVRSFGGDLDLLGRMAAAYIRGYQENGMLATAKHFPGRGDVDLFPGSAFLVNRKDAARVEGEDLLAFRKAIDAGVTLVMSEHIAIPSIADGSELPASVEKTLATEWLRGGLGFRGILTTDDLWYPHVVARFGAERVGVVALGAGHDVLLKPSNAVATIEAVASAVRAGEIPVERIDESVERVLYWKARLGLHRERLVDVDRIPGVVGSKAHRLLVQEVAERSLTLLVDDGTLAKSPLGSVVHVTSQKNENDPAPAAVAVKLSAALSVEKTFRLAPETDPEIRSVALSAAEAADTVVVSLFHMRTVYQDRGVVPERDLELVRKLVASGKRVVVMSYGNPYLVEDFPEVSAFLVGYGEGGFYGNQLVYADAFLRFLRGEIDASGKLPVRTR